MNSVANGKVRRATSFRRVYVQSAAGDAGGAIGAAFARVAPARRRALLRHGPRLLGPAVSQPMRSRPCSPRSAPRIAAAGCAVEEIADEAELCRRTAAAIADGKVVGWFQGRMEWGPRALGNRSIVCDPRRADMKAILNAKIKRRESFRPFAPSVLDEAVSEWFEEDDAVPFMMQVFQIREEKRAAHSRGHPRRRLGPPADGLATDQPALLSPDRELPRSHRRADGAQHLVQRERAGRLHAGGGARLLPAHQDGSPCLGRYHGVTAGRRRSLGSIIDD